MSVIQVLEKYERKHEAPDDDKAGWKRLIHGAVSKAATFLRSTGNRSVDVTLGPPKSLDFPNTVNFPEVQSPKENYASVSLGSDNNQHFVPPEKTCERISSTCDKNQPTPKFHSTPYKEKVMEENSVPIEEEYVEKGLNPVKNNTKKMDSPTGNPQSIDPLPPTEEEVSKRGISLYPDLEKLQSEVEELSVNEMLEPKNKEHLSFEKTNSERVSSTFNKNQPTPKFALALYNEKVEKINSVQVEKDYDDVKEGSTPAQENPKKIDLSSGNPQSNDSFPPTKEESSKGNIASYPDVTDLHSEEERLSLKKMIVVVEKSIAAEVNYEFDKERRKMDEHDKQVVALLAREEEKRGMEGQLAEMNWFQRVRESQLQVEQDFNAELDALLSKSKKSDPNCKSENDSELELVAKKRALIESISNTQKSYNSKYNDLLLVLQSSRVALVTEFHTEFDALKRNNNRLTDVISKSRCGNVSQSDFDECTRLLTFLGDLLHKINSRVEEYDNAKKLEDEANAKLMESLKKNEEHTKPQLTNKVGEVVKEEIEKEEISFEVSSECSKRRLDRLKYYNYVKKILKNAEESLEPFLNDDKYKHFRKDCQRAVNVPVNAISPTSSHHLIDKLDKLTDLLEGKSVPVMNRRFTATIHPLGIKYCQVLLARKIVKAGEDVVSSHPETGHAIASVVQALIIKYPILTLYLQAFFFRICPYLVPLDLKPHKDEPDEEFNKRLGFNYEQDEREETDKFLKRMSGVVQLYCAILIAHKRRGDFGSYPPLGVSELWIWLANVISIEPLPDISATILLDVLESSGHFMLSCYGHNFQKLLYIICTDYLVKINKVTAKGRGGPVERLKTFLEDVIKVKRISPPKGLLPPQFW